MTDPLSLLRTRTIPRLLNAEEPWTRYNTLKELMRREPADPELLSARKEMLNHPLVRELQEKASDWFSGSATRHNDPKLSHYYLSVLAEIGVKADDPGMEELLARVTAHQYEGLPAIRQNLPEKGAPPEDIAEQENWHALPCDAPVLLYSLKQMDCRHPVVEEGLKQVQALWAEKEPWFCHFFFVESQFRKTGADCPMAGLMALKMTLDNAGAQQAFGSLEGHREMKRSIYYFGRSKKFWTLKFPFVWYNALYMADALSLYPQFHNTGLYRELQDWILQNQTEEGLWKASSVFMPYKGWDFGQKKETSSWISFLCCRILEQSYKAENK